VRKRGLALAATAAATLAAASPAAADLPPSGPVSLVSNFGRLIHPFGRLSQLDYFPTAGAMTPDGRFVWTIVTRAREEKPDIQISSAATGRIVQQLNTPGPDRGRLRGIAIAHDGRHAYASDARDQIDVYDVNPATGRAARAKHPVIPVPAPAAAKPYDDFPPGPDRASYPEGLALTRDDHRLVVALNLSERVAVIDTRTRTVTQLEVRSDSKPGDRAYPAGVAIANGYALITNEGDGTVASLRLGDLSLTRATPSFADPSGVNPKRTHPNGVAAAPGGKSFFVALSGDDQVIEVDAADPSRVIRRFDVRRVPGGLGTQPVGLAVTPDRRTLFVADVGEDVVRAIALSRRVVRLSRATGRARNPEHHCRDPQHLYNKICAQRRRRRHQLHPAAVASRTIAVKPGDELARIPAGIYPRQVLVAPNGRRVAIVDSKGVGPGSTYVAGEGVAAHIPGVLQRIALPSDPREQDAAIVRAGKGGASVPVPVGRRPTAPAGSPLVGPHGGRSDKIKYVFYVVTENKTYDIILGDLARGNGDPCLTIYGERRIRRTHRDGSPCPYDRFGVNDDDDRAGLNPGQRLDNTPITPNEHRLARQFVTLDSTYSDSETSDDGHIWTSSAYAPEYDVRATLGSPHPFDLVYPISAPPKGFFFDSAVRQGVSFFNYGEAAAGLATPDTQANAQEESVRGQVQKNSEFILQYPSSGAIDRDPITQRETLDHDPCPQVPVPGTPCGQPDPTKRVSRMQYFSKRFQQQLATCQGAAAANPGTCQVPRYNELLFPNNHTAGTGAGTRTPDALVRDTDQAIGQLVQEVSHSPIWPYTAIFIVQDDAQDGADHVEGHRMTAFVASPYAKHGATVSTHYDHVSVIRTIELILGMKPTYMYDSLARPMWEAFQSKPAAAPFNRFDITPALMEERNVANAPMAKRSRSYRWVADAVPEDFINRLTWAYRYGTARACPSRVGVVPYDPCHDPQGEDEPEGDVARGKLIVKRLRQIARQRRAAAPAP
jgi:DNA-binding beta-propeller fold protein YncE